MLKLLILYRNILKFICSNALNLIFVSVPHQKKFSEHHPLFTPSYRRQSLAGKQSFTTRFALTDAIAYWQARLKRTHYQRLARMALDLLTIPPMPADPERIFSLTGLLLTANRARLRPDIIGASMAVGSWDKEGIIDIVDRKLKRL